VKGVEQLRYLVGWDWVSSADFVDAVFPLLWEIGDDSAMSLAALRRLLQHRYELGELWTVAGCILRNPSVEEGISDAYLHWIDHRRDCMLHDFVEDGDYADPDVLVPSVLSTSRMLCSEALNDASYSEVIASETWIESCSYRLVEESVMEIVERESLADSRNGRALREVRRYAGLRFSDTFAPAIPPPDSLLAPFPPRLGR
jgi:hypothetical protein